MESIATRRDRALIFIKEIRADVRSPQSGYRARRRLQTNDFSVPCAFMPGA